jgi:hypothetical protein
VEIQRPVSAHLVGWHRPADLGLFTDDHALENIWVSETERVGYGAVLRGEGDSCERRRQRVEGMTNLVDRAVLWLDELAGGVEGIYCRAGGSAEELNHSGWCLLALFEEESDLIVGVEEVVISHVLGSVAAVLAASAELRHWMPVQRELC